MRASKITVRVAGVLVTMPMLAGADCGADFGYDAYVTSPGERVLLDEQRRSVVVRWVLDIDDHAVDLSHVELLGCVRLEAELEQALHLATDIRDPAGRELELEPGHPTGWMDDECFVEEADDESQLPLERELTVEWADAAGTAKLEIHGVGEVYGPHASNAETTLSQQLVE